MTSWVSWRRRFRWPWTGLAVGGRCAVISYHSGEDRLTKQIFAQASHRRVHLPSRRALRVRCRGAAPAGVPRRATPRRRGDQHQSPRRSARLRAIARTVAP